MINGVYDNVSAIIFLMDDEIIKNKFVEIFNAKEIGIKQRYKYCCNLLIYQKMNIEFFEKYKIRFEIFPTSNTNNPYSKNMRIHDTFFNIKQRSKCLECEIEEYELILKDSIIYPTLGVSDSNIYLYINNKQYRVDYEVSKIKLSRLYSKERNIWL